MMTDGLTAQQRYYKKNAKRLSAEAMAKRKLDPLYVAKHQAWRHGMTLEDMDGLRWTQDNKCAGCGTPDPTHVDHDHACCPGKRSCGKCVRGLLCRQCNIGLGAAKDSVETLRTWIEYLERG